MKIVPLKWADAVEMVNMVNQLGARASGQPVQARPGGAQPTPFGGGFPFFGGGFQQQQQQQQIVGGSVLLLPLPRQNAVLMFGSDLRFPYYEKLITDLDNKNVLIPDAIPLKKASAQQVATYLTQFYATRYPGTTAGQNLIRFTYDTSSNTLYVQAGAGRHGRDSRYR